MICEPIQIDRIGDKIEWRCEVCGYIGQDIAAHFPARISRPCSGQQSEASQKTERIRRHLKNRKPCNCGKGK